MQKSISTTLLFIVLTAVFFVAVFVNNMMFRGMSIDLTEDKVYSLSTGTEQILANINEPINLYFFFSEDASKGMTAIRNYAEQVETLLKKYEEKSGGKIRLETIDPKAFSEQEDRAATFGLTAASLGAGSSSLYFGLAGTNTLDDAMIIPFFDPSKESFLEYDVSKLVYQLNNPSLTKLTIVSGLPLEGGQNPLTGQMDPANVVYRQLQQLFDVTLLDNSANALPENTQVLLIWHPQTLSEDLVYALDQYVLSGGKTIVAIDPHYESDTMAMMGGMGPNSSSLDLLTSYGIEVDLEQVVLDAQTGLEVRSPQGGIVRHFGFLGLGEAQVNRDDITTADLDSINGASFASIQLNDESQLQMTVLLNSSENASTMPATEYAMEQDPANLQRGFAVQAEQYVLAARFSGVASSHFKNAPQNQQADFVAQGENINIIVLADADIFADRFWVQQSAFFGQNIYTPFANNADLLTNLVENYGGSEGLIGIRSRGTFARPFTKVQEIAVAAEKRFREQEQRLQQQLEQTETQLAQLQSQQADALSLSAEQQATINEFMNQRIEIRKALRDVQFQLDKDIDSLGNLLAIINIAVAPLALVLLLFIMARLMRRRASFQ